VIPEAVEKLAEARALAKTLKDWKEADRLRDEIVALGWKMIDEKEGWRVEKV
jgi:cysteinyl-tRNA synthetase